jgi:hypothetical protein
MARVRMSTGVSTGASMKIHSSRKCNSTGWKSSGITSNRVICKNLATKHSFNKLKHKHRIIYRWMRNNIASLQANETKSMQTINYNSCSSSSRISSLKISNMNKISILRLHMRSKLHLNIDNHPNITSPTTPNNTSQKSQYSSNPQTTESPPTSIRKTSSMCRSLPYSPSTSKNQSKKSSSTTMR